MRTQLLFSIAVAVGLQCLTYTNSVAAHDGIVTRAQPQDETWGIGRRVVQTELSQPTLAPDIAAMSVEDLETAFWGCDYVATTRGVEATPIAICSAVYDELKAVKFAGDFGELLGWWKENKVAEHQRIASEEHERAPDRVDTRF